MKRYYLLIGFMCVFGCDCSEAVAPKISPDLSSTSDTSTSDAGQDSTAPDLSIDTGADAAGAVCGNGVVEQGETCDPPALCPTNCDDYENCTVDTLLGSAATCDVSCGHEPIIACIDGDTCCAPGCNANDDNDCFAFCGNGVTEANEICDGDCPVACDDQDACTTDTLGGDPTMCDVVCNYDPVTSCDLVTSDGCCPPNCNANDDIDCLPVCNNGVIEAGEACDGNCPVACDDNVACTQNVLVGDATTCDAVCTYPAIITCDLVSSDNCCPANCNNTDDIDCQAVCDNGVIEQGETCDPISSCPTTCDDNDLCTTDTPSGNAATCNFACSNIPITACLMVADNCCPSNCDASNDADCVAVCDNGVLEPGETCDPIASCPVSCDDADACTNDTTTGAAATCDIACSYSAVTACVDNDGCCPSTCNATNDTDCVAVPTAFRVTTLTLRDPHAFFLALGLFCIDVTGQLNGELSTALTTDGDNDGFLDLSLIAVQRPSNPTSMVALPMDLSEGDCTAPVAGTSCDQALPVSTTTYSNQAMGTCLQPVAGTTSGYNPGITLPTGPCFAGAPTSLTLDLGGILIPLSNVEFAATWNGNPATQLTNGLLYGFISEFDANNIIIPMSIPQVGGLALSELLPGGMGNCDPGDDRDLGPDGMTLGWWVYLNFTADVATYTGM